MRNYIPVKVVTQVKAAMLAAWGLWLLLPFWNVFDYGRQYAEMAVLAPEWLWGLVWFITGVLIIVAAQRGWAQLRNLMVVEFTLWFFMALLLMIGDWRPASSIMYTSVATATLAFYLYSGRRD